MEGIRAATTLSYHSSDLPVDESAVFFSAMNEISTLPVHSVLHIPKSTRPLFSQVLAREIKHAFQDGIWGFLRLHMLAKAVIRVPSRGGRKKRHVIKNILSSRIHRWQQGDLLSLWQEARKDSKNNLSCSNASVAQANIHRSLKLAMKGRYSDAMNTLRSQGCASRDDPSVFTELKHRHPIHTLPDWSEDIPSPLVVDSQAVLHALEAFPRDTSPGFSQLRAQHLLDAIRCTSAPDAQLCLDNLTILTNSLLAGKLDRRIAPWLSGAPLTALRKKGGGIRPIAVGNTIRRLVSRICCMSVRSCLPDIFLPYGQVGVGIKGGMEAAIHTLRSFITANCDREDFCCVKVDFTNAFNECHRTSFMSRLKKELPELFAWVQWTYHTAGELRFGDSHIRSTAGVQQGDPLGPLLLFLWCYSNFLTFLAIVQV